ncbi:hypothetical protein C8J57DRAFT_1462200 [Mycena rebaudengoi]|nr:hypothetical protein C8J57DRAFT_1462200 [Mycena rebaudengoi]
MRSEVLLCDICNSTFSSDLLPSLTDTAQLIEVIRSNCEPPEPSYPRSVLSSAPRELARYDAEICRLRRIQDEMQTARDALQSHYDACRSVFSAIHRLPSEILCGIFAFIPADVHLERIAGVCSRWHGLVMGTPALWCELWLNTDHLPSDAEERLMHILKCVLDRGANSPLTARVTCRLHPKLLELFAQYSHRWRDLYVHGIPYGGLGPLNSVRGHLPLLESLDINASGASPGAMDIFNDAPRLTRLTFCGSGDSLSSFPLTQLQHLSYEVEASGLGAALAVMSDLPRIVTCRLETQVSDSALPFGLSPIVANVPALVLAVIDDDERHGGEVLGEIFENLTIGVQDLSIVSTSHPYNILLCWPHPQSVAFFSRPSLSRTLKRLNIWDVIIAEDELIQCLGELPALEDLLIREHFHHPRLVTDSLLRNLTWTSDPACIVPRLRLLECLTFLEFADNLLLEFVLSRSEQQEKNYEGLFTVNMKFYNLYMVRELNSAVDQRLRDLEAQGKIAFSFSPDE